MCHIFILHATKIIKFSAVVWHSSLSKNNISDIERIQKSAVKIILKDQYKDYNSALKQLNLQTLSRRREVLCLRFAKKSIKLQTFKNLFPLNKKKHCMKKRRPRKFFENPANTDRYLKSSIPYMQSLLNKEDVMLKDFYASESCLNDYITIDNLH